MGKYYDTEPLVRYKSVDITPDLFTAQSVATGLILPVGCQFLSADLIVSEAFDQEMAIGHGVVSGQRETVGTFAECDATTGGTKQLRAWRADLNALLETDPVGMLARYQSAVPTVGRALLVVSLIDRQGRASL